MIIYIDVLIITSVYIDFLLIRATAAVMHSPQPSAVRAVLGALTGSLFSLVLLLPPMNGLAAAALRLLSAAAVIGAAFGFKDKRLFVKRMVLFFGVSIVFAGVCLLLSETFAEEMIFSRNGSVYFNISALVLVISTAAAYGAIRLFRRFHDAAPTAGFTVTVRLKDRRLISFPAIADTGNKLTDAVTGIPIIVACREQLAEISSEIPTEKDMPRKDWRLIPYSTASGSGLIPVFRPDEVFIRNDETHRTAAVECYIGVAENEMKAAVFDPSLLN